MARKTASPSQGEITIELQPGRLRRGQRVGLAAAGCLAGWIWLGNAGAGLLALWSWALWPAQEPRHVVVDLSRLRFARLGGMRVFWVERPARAHQVFVDEVDGAQFAALRRAMKSWLAS